MSLVLCVHVPIVLIAYSFSDDLYQTLWKTPKFLDGDTLLVYLICLLAFLGGHLAGAIKMGTRKQTSTYPPVSIRKLRTLLFISLTLTLAGALIWIASAISKGLTFQDLISFFARETLVSNHIKTDFFITLPGVTTMTQFGMAAAIIAGLLYYVGKRRKMRSLLIVLLGMDAIRAFLLSERISFIEVAVPLVVLAVHFRTSRPGLSQRLKLVFALAPVIGVALLFTVFSGMEAFRSWTYYAGRSDDSLITFAAGRLTGYYVTAVNNSALILTRMPRADAPIFTQQWFWRMPLIKDTVGATSDAVLDDFVHLLKSNANPEFNNPGGPLLPVVDFGFFPGLAYWAAFGFLVSRLYRSFRGNHVAGLLLYPIVYVGLLEMSRLLYLSDGRSFPSLVFLAFAAVYCRLPRRRKLLSSPPVEHTGNRPFVAAAGSLALLVVSSGASQASAGTIARHEINIRSVGVLGDGRTIDSAAIENALAKHPQASFYFPPGNYLLGNFKRIGLNGGAFSGSLRFADRAILKCIDLSANSGDCVQFVGGSSLIIDGLEIAFVPPAPQTRSLASGFALHLLRENSPKVTRVRIDSSSGAGIYEEEDVDAVFANISIHNTSADGFTSINSSNTHLSNLTTDVTLDDGLSIINYSKQPDNRGFVATNIAVSHSAARGITVPGQSSVQITHFSVNQTCAQGVLIVTDTTFATRTPDQVTISQGEIHGAGRYTNVHNPCQAISANPIGNGLQYTGVGTVHFDHIKISESTAAAIAGNTSLTGPSAGSVTMSDIVIAASSTGDKKGVGGVTIYNTRRLVMNKVSIENAFGGFFVAGNDEVMADDLQVKNVKGFLNRSYDFESNGKVQGNRLLTIDDQDQPTANSFVDFRNRLPSSYKAVEAHIAKGKFTVQKEDGSMLELLK